MPLRQIIGIIIREPYLFFIILPDKRFLGQVNGYALIALHERRANLGIAKDNQCGRAQLFPDLLGSCGMIDSCEHGHAFHF